MNKFLPTLKQLFHLSSEKDLVFHYNRIYFDCIIKMMYIFLPNKWILCKVKKYIFCFRMNMLMKSKDCYRDYLSRMKNEKSGENVIVGARTVQNICLDWNVIHRY